jgi:hypothetical protein
VNLCKTRFSHKPHGHDFATQEPKELARFTDRPLLATPGIRFQAHPRFSARFKVKCADEAGARRFLVPLLLEEFERFPDLIVEGRRSSRLLSYEKNPRVRRVSTVQDEVRTRASFPG